MSVLRSVIAWPEAAIAWLRGRRGPSWGLPPGWAKEPWLVAAARWPDPWEHHDLGSDR